MAYNDEKFLLAMIAKNKEFYDYAIEQVPPRLFQTPLLREIYKALIQARGDISTAQEILIKNGKSFDIGQLIFTTKIPVENVDMFNNLTRRIINDYLRSKLSSAMEQDVSSLNLITSLYQELEQIIHKQKTADNINNVWDSYLKAYQDFIRKDEELVGIDTLIKPLNEISGGFRKGELIVIGGRPGAGKSVYALNSLFVNGLFRGHPTLLISLEMTKERLMLRGLSGLTGVPFMRIRNYQLTQDDITKIFYPISCKKCGGEDVRVEMDENYNLKYICDHCGELQRDEVFTIADYIETQPIFLVDFKMYNTEVAGYRTIGDVIEEIIRTNQKSIEQFGRPLECVIVDYLQLIAGSRRYENTERELASIAYKLHTLAQDLNLTVIVTSQLKRKEETTPDIQDLKGSGGIEAAADWIFILKRNAEGELKLYHLKARDGRILPPQVLDSINELMVLDRYIYDNYYIPFQEMMFRKRR